TFRLVAQMTGTHGYRRIDAREALAEGLAGKLPASWRHAEENAAVEIWLTIEGATAVCGLRLSDRTMRHRTYKMEHLPASLRPARGNRPAVRTHDPRVRPRLAAGRPGGAAGRRLRHAQGRRAAGRVEAAASAPRPRARPASYVDRLAEAR